MIPGKADALDNGPVQEATTPADLLSESRDDTKGERYGRWRAFLGVLPWLTLVGIALSLVQDPKNAATIAAWLGVGNNASPQQIAAAEPIPNRQSTIVMAGLMIGFMVTTVASILLSSKVSLRKLLATVLSVAVLTGLVSRSDDIRWLGQHWRASKYKNELDALAERLSQNWPDEDGEVPKLGPFTSYPFGRPSVLLFLNPLPLGNSDTVIAAIERPDAEQLFFQLGGRDLGVWMHWHVNGNSPSHYKSGLDDSRTIGQSQPLSDRWTLVRMKH